MLLTVHLFGLQIKLTPHREKISIVTRESEKKVWMERVLIKRSWREIHRSCSSLYLPLSIFANILRPDESVGEKIVFR